MTKKKLFLYGFLIIVLFYKISLFGDKNNKDFPEYGKWDLKLEKKWTRTNAGKSFIINPHAIEVNDDGGVYVYDQKNMKILFFDKDGTFIKTFGRKGKGPGEISDRQTKLFFLENQLLVTDNNRVHYFSKNGKFIKTRLTGNHMQYAKFFINKDEYLYSSHDLYERKCFIAKYNLKTKINKKIIKYTAVLPKGSVFSKTRVRMFGGIGTMPGQIAGYSNGKIYFGVNDFYRINRADLDGKVKSVFSIDRERKKIPIEKRKKYYRKIFKGMQLDVFNTVLKTFPSSNLYFYKIIEQNKLIYIFIADFPSNIINVQRIDIFSLDGDYLYSAEIDPGRDYKIRFPIDTIKIYG